MEWWRRQRRVPRAETAVGVLRLQTPGRGRAGGRAGGHEAQEAAQAQVGGLSRAARPLQPTHQAI